MFKLNFDIDLFKHTYLRPMVHRQLLLLMEVRQLLIIFEGQHIIRKICSNTIPQQISSMFTSLYTYVTQQQIQNDFSTFNFFLHLTRFNSFHSQMAYLEFSLSLSQLLVVHKFSCCRSLGLMHLEVGGLQLHWCPLCFEPGWVHQHLLLVLKVQ